MVRLSSTYNKLTTWGGYLTNPTKIKKRDKHKSNLVNPSH
jgi:hypothetical protein